MSFIRDAEIEHIIRVYAEPLFAAAGLDPAAVRIELVADNGLNAFVADGQRLFINTGLLMQARNASELIGVIAHEIGHIAGGHLARGQDALDRARRTALLSTLIGIAAAVAAGDGGAGAAVLGGGQTVAQRGFMSFTRGMESAADQAGLSFLERAGYSAEGLLTFLDLLADQDLLPESRQVEYIRTHPLTSDRIRLVANHVAQSRMTGQPLPAGFDDLFARLQAKLIGFMDPQQALRRYPASDTSIAGRYARAIATFQRGDLAVALSSVDALIAEEPQNPFFHELRGQLLLETGRAAEARPSYDRALQLLPGEPLLLVALAQAKIESGGPADLAGAIADLNQAISRDPRPSALTWRLLAIAYGRTGDMGMSAVALAEENLARGDGEAALMQVSRAEPLVPFGSPGWLRLQDVRRAAEELEEED